MNRKSSPGFTLIELLVVIGVIAVLSAILLPAFAAAKAKAWNIACLSNLKQLQVCCNLYSGDNQDSLPPNNAIDDFDTGNPLDNGASWCAGNARTDVSFTNIEHGVLFQYNTSTAIYHCPADRASVRAEDGTALGMARTRSYSLSQSINGYPEQYAAQLDEPIPSFKKFSLINDPVPTQLITFLDVHEDEITDSIFGIPTRDSDDFPGNWDDLPADRHGRGCNLGFADGHAEYWKWKHAKKAAASGDAGQPVAAGEQEDYQRVESGIRQ